MTFLVILMFLGISCSVIRCQLIEFVTESQYDDDDLHKVAVANNKFALNLFKTMKKSGNHIFSPFTLSTALSMLNMGAKGETAQEISQVLGHDGLGLGGNDVHEEFQKFEQYFRHDIGYTMDYLNSILIQEGFPVLDGYKNAAKTYYNSSVRNVDFAGKGAEVKEEINKWVADATRGKIPEFLKYEIEPLTRFFLLSAVYFKGTWRTVFDPKRTRQSNFFNDGTVPVKVPMMSISRVRFPYANFPDLGLQALELPYKSDEASMVILLPHDRMGLQAMKEKLDMPTIENILRNLRLTMVLVFVPKFRIEGNYDLAKPLVNLGMRKAFERDGADLSGMTGEKNMHVEEVLHKAVIDVTEEGTEAAASTGISTATRSRGPRWATFRANHPFMFFIRDVKTDVILFMGSVTKL